MEGEKEVKDDGAQVENSVLKEQVVEWFLPEDLEQYLSPYKEDIELIPQYKRVCLIV